MAKQPPEIVILCDETTESLRKDLEQRIAVSDLDIGKHIEDMATDFGLCNVDVQNGMIDIVNFEPNNVTNIYGMFIFEIHYWPNDCEESIDLNYDFGNYGHDQTLSIPGTDIKVYVNPILLNLYDELDRGRDHGVLCKVAPEVANRYLKPPREDCDYYVGIESESHEYAHLVEMCQRFESAATHEKYTFVGQDGEATLEFDATDLCYEWSNGLYRYQISNIQIISYKDHNAARRTVEAGICKVQNGNNKALLRYVDLDSAVYTP